MTTTIEIEKAIRSCALRTAWQRGEDSSLQAGEAAVALTNELGGDRARMLVTTNAAVGAGLPWRLTDSTGRTLDHGVTDASGSAVLSRPRGADALTLVVSPFPLLAEPAAVITPDWLALTGKRASARAAASSRSLAAGGPPSPFKDWSLLEDVARTLSESRPLLKKPRRDGDHDEQKEDFDPFHILSAPLNAFPPQTRAKAVDRLCARWSTRPPAIERLGREVFEPLDALRRHFEDSRRWQKSTAAKKPPKRPVVHKDLEDVFRIAKSAEKRLPPESIAAVFGELYKRIIHGAERWVQREDRRGTWLGLVVKEVQGIVRRIEKEGANGWRAIPSDFTERVRACERGTRDATIQALRDAADGSGLDGNGTAKPQEGTRARLRAVADEMERDPETTAKNAARRVCQRETETTPTDGTLFQNVAADYPAPQLVASLSMALQRLSPEVQEAIILRHVLDHSVAEVAREIDRTRSATERILGKGLAELRRELGVEGW